MSVLFDRTHDNNNGDCLGADGSAMKPTIPFSVSIWFYFATAPGETQTIWFHGDKDVADEYLVLEAVATGGTKVRARLKSGGNEITVGPTVAIDTGWNLATLVVTSPTGSNTKLELFLNDEANSVTATGTFTPSVSAYDRFAIGRWAGWGGGSTVPGSFYAELAAVWNRAITSANHDTMFADSLNDDVVRRPPEIFLPKPELGYWVLAGHDRHGLKIHNSQFGAKRGDLNNEASNSSQPDLQLLAGEPLWSCQTPAVLFPNPDPVSPSELPVRRRKVRPSRSNPQFFVYAQPELIEPWINDPGKAPMWDNPNFVMMARIRLDHANHATYVPPVFTTKDPYLYHTYLTQMTRRIADWFEYQGFQKGRGSEGGGNYEGTLFLQDLGWQYHRDGDRGLEPTIGQGFGIPLEQHRHDDASDGAKPWACWFNENGKRLTKDYADLFWPLLKAELDRRGLCYPKRMHFDLESSPEPIRVAPGANNHTFSRMLTDDRSGVNAPTPPGEILADGKTLNTLWSDATTAGITYDAGKKFDDADNKAWRQWYLSWQSPIRQEAMDYAMMAEAVVQFPLMKWSNYLDFVADNPDYKYFQYDPDEARNSPVSSIAADYSSPVLYPVNNKLSEIIAAGYGVTGQSAQLRVWRDAIDACVNSSSPLPVFPWITSVGYREKWDLNAVPPVVIANQNSYKMTREDLRHVLWYAWKRGVNEFGLWITNNNDFTRSVEFDATYEECKDFANTVKCMMNTNGSRTSRMGRTYRICR